MKKIILMMTLVLFLALTVGVRAQTPSLVAEEATESGEVEPTAVPKEDITQPGSKEVSYRLETVLEEQRVGDWNVLNTGKKIVRLAINRGAPANTIVLLLLLPLVATLVSVLHYVIGLSGYGIFMPTMIAVTFLATGIFGGLLLFALILLISLMCRLFLRKLKLHFLTSRTINLLFISVGTFGLMMATSFADLVDVSKISIFPVLFMIMLAEDFVRTQLLKSRDEAKRLMIGTLVLSMSGALVMSVRRVQELVLLNPELVVLAVLVINLVVGNYKGIRLSEIARFKKAIRS